MPSAPDAIETPRLSLRRPRAADVDVIFARYASDPEVTRFVGWPRHRTVDDTRSFLSFSDDEWAKAPAGPYLIFARDTGRLLGSTGLIFETPYRAATGYVLAKDEWGRGYATEALDAMVSVAGTRASTASMRSAIASIPHRRACSKNAILPGKACCAAMRSLPI